MITIVRELEPTVEEFEPAPEAEYSLAALPCGTPLIELPSFPAVIGRGADVDVRLNDIYISRRHCEIIAANGALVVHDLGSKNGTIVNGVRTEFSSLGPDDVLTLGGMSFVVHIRSAIAGSLNAR
jgi:pSer/pThr/pTyr-binding forkhead associated (FHA) protein